MGGGETQKNQSQRTFQLESQVNNTGECQYWLQNEDNGPGPNVFNEWSGGSGKQMNDSNKREDVV